MNQNGDLLEAELDAATAFPWPPRARESGLEAFVQTWREATFHPASFFSRLPKNDHPGAAILYNILIAVIVAGVQLFWSNVIDTKGVYERLGLGLLGGGPGSIVDFLLTPLLAILGLYFAAAICHVTLKLVKGQKYGFNASLRTFGFTSSPTLFAVLPFAGTAIGVVWACVLSIVGLREVHETTTAKAAMAVLLPGAIAAVFALLVVILGAALLGTIRV